MSETTKNSVLQLEHDSIDQKSVDILLVNPVFLNLDETERSLMAPYFPLGLLYLAAFLRERDFRVEIFDGTFLGGLDDFSAALKEYPPRTVGIGVVGPNREVALQMAALAHQRGAVVILGGPDPTLTPDRYLQEPTVDFIVHHEGELTLVELMKGLLNDPIEDLRLLEMEGIAYRTPSGEIIVNPRRSYILNLDELPLPARDLIDVDRYLDVWRHQNGYASLTLSVSRGCPYGCKWCQDSVHGPDFRQRSPQDVVAEVKALMGRYQIDRLRLVDDVDGIDRAWLEAWAECAEAEGAVLPFEALCDLKRQDIPMLDVRDSL